MALLPKFFLDAVVSIGVPDNQSTSWIGTGFIVGRPSGVDDEGEMRYHTFLITNKHVLSGKSRIVVRFGRVDRDEVIDYPVDVSHAGVNELWVGNPAESVDVAAFFINCDVLYRDGAVFEFYSLDRHVMGVADMVEEGVSEGDGIFVLGYPMGFVSEHFSHVIARMGCIARIRGVLAGKESAILIDANIFPGNSGGPVVIRPESSCIVETRKIERAALIGIVRSYVPYMDVAISRQTGNPRIIFEENSGLAIVETVDSIRATVELCFQLKLNAEEQDSPNATLPAEAAE